MERPLTFLDAIKIRKKNEDDRSKDKFRKEISKQIEDQKGDAKDIQDLDITLHLVRQRAELLRAEEDERNKLIGAEKKKHEEEPNPKKRFEFKSDRK